MNRILKLICIFCNHFNPSKAIKPLRCKGLLSVKEYEGKKKEEKTL